MKTLIILVYLISGAHMPGTVEAESCAVLFQEVQQQVYGMKSYIDFIECFDDEWHTWENEQ